MLVARERLRPTSMATSVRVREQGLVVADGPFAETKEQIAGFYIIDVRDLDEAIEIASRNPGARSARSRSGRCGRSSRRASCSRCVVPI